MAPLKLSDDPMAEIIPKDDLIYDTKWQNSSDTSLNWNSWLVRGIISMFSASASIGRNECKIIELICFINYHSI